MLFWLFLVIFVACCVWAYIYRSHYDFMPVFSAGLSGVAFAVSLIIFACANIGVDGYVERMNQRYDSLVYQYENDIYDNDNDLGKRELITDIQSWNEDLANYKAIQDDFWIGTYIPNIYDQFEFIELERE